MDPHAPIYIRGVESQLYRGIEHLIYFLVWALWRGRKVTFPRGLHIRTAEI